MRVLNFHCCWKVTTTKSFLVFGLNVIWCILSEIYPITDNAVFIQIGPPLSSVCFLFGESDFLLVRSCVSKLKIAHIVAWNVESISCRSWRNKPTLQNIPIQVTNIWWNLHVHRERISLWVIFKFSPINVCSRLINQRPSDSVWSNVTWVWNWRLRFGLNFARKWVRWLTSNDTILTINLGCDFTLVEAISFDCQVHSSCGVSNIWTCLKNNWHRFGLVACWVVKSAMGWFLP